MLNRYENFRENLILEGIINETYIYYAPPLKKALNRIKDNEIASDLLSVLKTDIKADVTFVNIDKDGYLSFTTARNAGNNLSKIWKHVSPEGWFNNSLHDNDLDNIWDIHINKDENDVYTKSRNSLRIGRFINKIFPGKYNDKQIEEFVNKFKAAIEAQGESFEIVEGDDIAKWYDYRNYAELKGTLGNSCMKEKSESIFKIYTKNPEVCRMLILKEDDKILGRALIWKLDSFKKYGQKAEDKKPEYFLDRQYTIKESDVVKFRNYAIEQGWCYKSYNNHHSFSAVTFEGNEFNADMTVQLGKNGSSYDYGRYPYVDTFRRYDPENGILYNDDEEDSSNKGHYLLSDTGGGYTEIENGIWSEWYDRRIPEDEAVWSDWADSYIYRERAVEVTVGSRRSRGWYPDDCEDITYDEWIDEYINTDDSVYSDRYGYSLLADNAVEVIEDLDSDGDVLTADSCWYHKDDDDIIDTSDLDSPCYNRLTDLYRDWGRYEYIHKDLLTKNFKGEWIISLFKVEVYNIIAKDDSVDITDIEWLSEDDAAILGYDINTETEMITDQFRYHQDIEELLPTIHELCNKEISKIRDILDEKGQLRLKFDDVSDKQYINSLRSKLRKYDNRISDIDNKIYINIDI